MKKLIFALLGISLLIAGCLNDEEEEAEADYVVPVKGRFQLLFRSNPSTGLQWYWMNRSQTLSVDTVGYGFLYDNPGRPGSHGTEYWTFEGKQPGIDTLEFQYRRFFGSAEAYDTTFVIVQVKQKE